MSVSLRVAENLHKIFQHQKFYDNHRILLTRNLLFVLYTSIVSRESCIRIKDDLHAMDDFTMYQKERIGFFCFKFSNKLNLEIFAIQIKLFDFFIG